MKRAGLNYLVIVALAASAVFTSCQKDNDEGYTVSGTIESSYYIDWKDVKVSVSYDEGETWAASTKTLNGKFTIKLPIPDENNLQMLTSTLPDEIYTSDNSVKTSEANFFVRKDGQKGILRPLLVSVGYTYVDKDVWVGGTNVQTFVEGVISLTTVYDLVMPKGWNIILRTVEHTPPAHTTTYLTASPATPAPSDVIWWMNGFTE